MGIVIGTLVALATGCGGSDGTTPVHAVGVVSVPRAPLIVQPLPKGWSVREVQRPGLLPDSMQTLYLPPGSTVDHGPALAVGSYGQDEGYTLCGNARRIALRHDTTVSDRDGMESTAPRSSS